jgi:hypothetical protein
VFRLLGGVEGVFSCQKRLRLSWKVDECKPLSGGLVLEFAGDALIAFYADDDFAAGAHTRSR